LATIQELKTAWSQERETFNNSNDWNNKDKRKQHRQRLQAIETQMVQQLELKAGIVFYDSWGYDQTQNDFCEIVEVSPTKKTVLCRMMSKDRVDDSSVKPCEPYGIVFRLKVSQYSGEPTLRGSYPFVQGFWPRCKIPESERGAFDCLKLRREDTDQIRFWSSDSKRDFCKGCQNFIDEPHQDYREGSFSLYTKPVYETPFGMGH
jgi:hypothetical protein